MSGLSARDGRAIEAILFDKDGTLIDFDRTWTPVVKQQARSAAEAVGRPDLTQGLLTSVGYDPRSDRFPADSLVAAAAAGDIIPIWTDILATPGAESLVVEMIARTDTNLDHVRPIEGDLGGLFARLRGTGRRLGLATMDSEAAAHGTLKALGVDGHFDFVAGYDSGHGTKPGPGMARAFCRRLGIDPGLCAVVGDTPHDMHMGKSAGVGLIIGVLTGSGRHEDLDEAADIILGSVHDLADRADRTVLA